jgi:argininosuccinate lyase
MVLWSSQEFKFVELDDAFTSGSSIMTQKKNPDVAELTRGKVGRVYGDLFAMLTILKGLPLSYNRDLQEDKEPLFDAIDTVEPALSVFQGMLATARFNTERMYQATQKDFSTATDLADYLVRQNIPFRRAHEMVGKLVAYCLDQNKDLTELTVDELKEAAPEASEEALEVLSVESSVNSRKVYGGTGRSDVERQLKAAKYRLEDITPEPM